MKERPDFRHRSKVRKSVCKCI